MVNTDTVVNRIVTTALDTLRTEFTSAIERATMVMKEELSKALSEVMADIYPRLDNIEGRITAIEKKPVDIDVSKSIDALRKEIQDTARVANDAEQYNRRYNIRTEGLVIEQNITCDYRETVTNFIKQKLLIRDIEKEDLEAAHPLPV